MHGVVIASFVSCILVFFLLRKKAAAFIDSYIKSSEEKLQESHKIRLQAKELMDELLLQRCKYVNEGEKTIASAKLRAEADIKEAKEVIHEATERQLKSLSARMKEEEFFREHQIKESVAWQAKKMVVESVGVATRETPRLKTDDVVQEVMSSLGQKNIH